MGKTQQHRKAYRGFQLKDKQGKVQVKAGMPRLSELPSLTGLPEQKIDALELQKFR